MSKVVSAHRFRPQVKDLPWLGLAALLLYQAWMFYFRLPLSLGPRVIFEPWALRNGYQIYNNLIDIHPPLMPWFLAVLGYIVPNGLKLAKLTLVGLLSLSTLFTFLVARRHMGIWPGLTAAGLFVLWAPGFSFGKLWYEAFLAPAFLVYILAYQPSDKPRAYRWCIFWGLLGGVTVLLKQHAALVFGAFLIWEGITALSNRRPWKTILRDLVVTGMISFIPVALAVGYQYLSTGSIDNLIYWLVSYPFASVYREMASKTITNQQMLFLAGVAFLLPAAAIMTWTQFRKKDPIWKQAGLWILVLVSGAFLAYPRFEMFHLQPIMAVVIVISVWCLTTILHLSSSYVLNRAFSIGIAVSFVMLSGLMLINTHKSAITSSEPRHIAEYSPLQPLAEQIAPFIGPGERLYIITDDENTGNLYYLLGELPPSYWIFHYPFYMTDDVKCKILASLQESPPEWVVYLPERWEMDKYAPELINYVESNYQAESTLTFFTGPVLLMRRIPGR